MTQHMQRELDNLKKMLLSLSAEVEDRVRQAVRALEKMDAELARQVVEGDDEIDQREVDLEEECLKVLALHQPVAIDLRFLISVLKINNDLERIADLAVNVAERALVLFDLERIPTPFDYSQMAGKVETMLEKALDALVNLDEGLARDVCNLDDEVDGLHSRTYAMVKQQIREHPERLDPLTQYLTVSRHLERVADLATNIAEDVIYMIRGEIVRHTLA